MAGEKGIQLTCIAAGNMGNNAYILCAEGRQDCIVIDTAGDGREIVEALEKLGRKPALLLLTHGHFDHITGVPLLREKYGMPVAIHELEKNTLSDPRHNLSASVLPGAGLSMGEPEILLKDGQPIEEAGLRIDVIHTPGHSPGSVCFVCEDALFSGDTLFHMSVGRTDFPGGNIDKLLDSIKILFDLEGDYGLFPGHEDSSTLDAERAGNFFIKQYAPELIRPKGDR